MVSLVKTYKAFRCFLGLAVVNEPHPEQEDTASIRGLELEEAVVGTGTPDAAGPSAAPQAPATHPGANAGPNRSLLARIGTWAFNHIGHASVLLWVWTFANSTLLVQPSSLFLVSSRLPTA